MADLSITASAVLAGSNAVTEKGIAGATVTAGQVVYRNATTKKFLLADTDSATAGVRDVYGIALNGASDNQPLEVLRSGDMTINAAMTAGATYYLSPTPGGICPLADLTAGDYYTIIGIAKSTTVLSVKPNASGAAVPA